MGVLEEINAKLDSILASVNALESREKVVVEKTAGKTKAAAKKEEKVEELQEIEEEGDPFASEPTPLTASEVGDNCKKIMDAKADKKAFRTGFVKILKDKFGADNVSKVPVDKLGELMAEIEKLGKEIK